MLHSLGEGVSDNADVVSLFQFERPGGGGEPASEQRQRERNVSQHGEGSSMVF
jgi:hypothetical protein